MDRLAQALADSPAYDMAAVDALPHYKRSSKGLLPSGGR